MNKIRDDNYYTVLGWMSTVLGLQGNERDIFAIIHSFSQDGESEYAGSISYLQNFTNIKSKQTVYTMLERLTKKKYITKREFKDGEIKRCAYKVNFATIDALRAGLSELKPNNGT